MTIIKQPAWIIRCNTGCTCCAYENHIRGPYKSKEDAINRVQFFRTGAWYPLTSQYARRGRYTIDEVTLEILPDGRAIIGETVFDSIQFAIVNQDGSSLNNDSEWLCNESRI